MKRRLAGASVLAMLAMLATLATLATPCAVHAQQKFQRGQALDATASVRVFAMAGSITVMGWDRDSIHVDGTIGPGLTPFAGGTRSGWKLGTYDGRQDPTSPAHLTIRVPRRAQLWIKTTSAAISVKGVDGSLDLYSIEGRIDVAGAPRELAAETMRGSVHVTGTPGWLRAKSGTGGITFDGVAQDVALSTVSGDIVSSSRFTRGRFESVRGDIGIAGPIGHASTVDVDNHEGRVTLRIDPKASAAFGVYTLTGRIVNELSAAKPRKASGTGTELAVTTGDGTARVTVRTYAGDVTLRPMTAAGHP